MHISNLVRTSVLLAGTVAPWLVAANEGPSDVIDLTSDTFASFIESEPLALVEFFAPWCGHCKALAPHYEESATALKEKLVGVKLAKVDCVDQAELCTTNGIAGYPTLKVYRNGTPTEYGGPRQAEGIISYMTKQSLPAVTAVTAENHDQIKEADRLVVIAYVSSTEEAPVPVFSKVADTLREEYLFGLTSDAAAIKAAGVTPPAIVVWKKFDEGRNDVASADVSAITEEVLTEFIKSKAMPLFDEISGDNYAKYATAGLPLAYLFVDPQDPKKEEYINELKPIAEEHKGAVSFVWIDAVKFVDHAKSLVLMEPKWPSFVIQDVKAQLKYPIDQATEINARVVGHHIKQFVNGRLEPKLKSEPVPEKQEDSYYHLVGSTFEEVVFDDSKDVFVQFSAPWCGHCKRLAPTWESLADKYSAIKDRLLIAKMDATENDVPVSAGFSISGFPTIKFKPAGSRDFIEYEGDRSLESLIEFVEEKAKNSLVLPPKEEDKLAGSAGIPVPTEGVHDEL